MPSQFVPSVRGRTTRGLNRGSRTPTPSPTRTFNGLPHCGASIYGVTDIPVIPGLASDSSPDQLDCAADIACTEATPDQQGSPASGLQLKLHELMEVSTPRGHDQEARGTSSAAAPVDWAGPTLDAAWTRIRTPSPEARTYAPPQWMPVSGTRGAPTVEPPQWMPFRQHAPSPVAWAGPTLDAAWTGIRTPSSEARTSVPQAPPSWPQGVPEKPLQRMPFREPSAEPPPPPAPVVATGPRGRAHANESKTAVATNKPSPGSISMPKEGIGPAKGVLSVGSVGHPYTCQIPCKFVHKNRGCKDGADCNRCHVCLWNRYDEASRATSMRQ